MGLGQISRAQYNHSLSNEPKAKTNIAIIFNGCSYELKACVDLVLQLADNACKGL